MNSTQKLVIFCEGPTEQHFCNQVLQPHLFPRFERRILTLAMGRKRDRHVYGLGAGRFYGRLRKFIANELEAKKGQAYRFTTFIDLYSLPLDFPGFDRYPRDPVNPHLFVERIESSFAEDIADPRFLPYIQLHEFETLLFVDPEAFGLIFEEPADQIRKLQEIVRAFPSVEHINEGRTTAPSKRLIEVIPAYKGLKASAGPEIAGYIGLPALRKSCRHFDSWLKKLEAIDWDAGY